MEYGYPSNNSCNNKEKRPPLKRGQLKGADSQDPRKPRGAGYQEQLQKMR
jgi:hypothetical protein